MLTKSLLLAASMMAAGTNAFWRMPCRGVLTNERVDPVDTPEKVAAHVHQVHGGNNFALMANNQDLRDSECTSCMVKGDNSAYWYPQLYWQDNEGKLTLVESSGGALIYYLLRPEDGVSVKPFPDNFRMIAGDGTLRSWPYPSWEVNDPRLRGKGGWSPEDELNEAKKRQHAIGWNCLNEHGPYEDTIWRKNIPQGMKCDFGLRAEVVFPSCWNGKDDDTSDHRSHMAYPSLVEAGECPEGYPIRLPTLLYEVTWNTWPLVQKGNGRLVLSTGDPTGYGWHADFMNGWDTSLLNDAIRQCTNMSGEITDCPVFVNRGLLQDEKTQKSCKKPRIEVNEEVFGPLSELPGCNPIIEGPERGHMGGCGHADKAVADPIPGLHGGKGGKGGSSSGSSSGSHSGSGSGSNSGSGSSSGSGSGSNSGSGSGSSSGSSESKKEDKATGGAAVVIPADNESVSGGSGAEEPAQKKPDATVEENVEPDVVVEWVTETVYVTGAAKAKRHAHGHMH